MKAVNVEEAHFTSCSRKSFNALEQSDSAHPGKQRSF